MKKWCVESEVNVDVPLTLPSAFFEFGPLHNKANTRR